MLRRSIETFQCSFFTSLISINNTYFLNLYKHLEGRSLDALTAHRHGITDTHLKEAFSRECYRLYRQERSITPYYWEESKHAAFLYHLYQMLNIPAFEQEMSRRQDEPSMRFMQAVWQNYKKNWLSAQP